MEAQLALALVPRTGRLTGLYLALKSLVTRDAASAMSAKLRMRGPGERFK